MLKRTRVFLMIIAFYALSVEAKILYVDGTIGNDTITYANNFEGAPWATLGRALWGNADKSSANLSQAAQAGDIVLVSAGTYSYAGSGTRSEPAFNPANSGTAVNYITIRAIGTVRLTLSSGTGPVFGANNRRYIVWDGFTANENDHAVYAGEPSLVGIWGSNYIIVQNSTLIGKNLPEDGRNHSAIRFEGSSNCLYKNNLSYGFTGAGENHSDVFMYSNEDIVIENNEMRDGNGAIFVKGNYNNRIIFRYNLVYNMAGSAVRFGPAARDCLIYQNVIYNSTNGLRNDSWAGNIGRDNIFANNTLDGCGSWLAAIRLHGNDYPSRFYNNIISNTQYGSVGSTMSSTPDANVFEHNLYYNNGSQWMDEGSPARSFTYWTETWGKDTLSPPGRVSDPRFVDRLGRNYRLQIVSPARTIGIDILDLDGDGSTTNIIPAGAYITGNEVIGIATADDSLPPDISTLSAPTGLVVIE